MCILPSVTSLEYQCLLVQYPMALKIIKCKDMVKVHIRPDGLSAEFHVVQKDIL